MKIDKQRKIHIEAYIRQLTSQTERQTDRQTGVQTFRQTDRQLPPKRETGIKKKATISPGPNINTGRIKIEIPDRPTLVRT